MYNSVTLVGRLGKDPKLSTATEKPLVNFSIATNERWKDKNGETQERTDWHNIVAWGKLAQYIVDVCKTGTLVFITGSLRTRSWEDKETGTNRYATEVNIGPGNVFKTLAGGKERASGDAKPTGSESRKDDDLPF